MGTWCSVPGADADVDANLGTCARGSRSSQVRHSSRHLSSTYLPTYLCLPLCVSLPLSLPPYLFVLTYSYYSYSLFFLLLLLHFSFLTSLLFKIREIRHRLVRTSV
ncbi:hypothetical protein F5Y04DRAFT_178820 [Hypomontagnella monticulosa]|nr:hypothetical protein F5Y04DRAFT_178820 [Hypomontagnella monticulosa]